MKAGNWIETNEEKKTRLKLRITYLTTAKKEKELDLKRIKIELKDCQERLDKLGDFP